MMRTDCLNREPGTTSARRAWLASLLLQRPTWLARFAARLSQLASLGRGQRLRLERKAAVSLAGAALLLSLAGPLGPPPARAETDATAATIPVVNGEVALSNNGKCSLMEAIINARATSAGQMKPDCVAGNISGPDVVSLPSGGLFVLTAPHNTQHGPTGLPVITTDMVIEGNGATITRSTAAGTPYFRILDVDPGVTFTLRNTTISNGDVTLGDVYGFPGGGIHSQGNLIVEGSTITGNRANTGGGIDGSQVTVSDSVVSQNASDSFFYGAGGGGIRANNATVTGSQIVDNEAYSYYGGGRGGGIAADTLTLAETTVYGNLATGFLDWGRFGGGVGGGVYVQNGTILRSTISGNSATSAYYYPIGWIVPGQGGGLAAYGEVAIVNSTISGNDAMQGGGVFIDSGAQVSLSHSTVTGNHAYTVTVEYDGENLSYYGNGGGVFVESGYHWPEGERCGKGALSGVILSGNTADDVGQEAYLEQRSSSITCVPELTTDAFNVLGHSGSLGGGALTAGPTDVVPTAALSAILGPLADNGGPTQTHALLAGSPALDLAPTASCMVAPIDGVDQRGLPRGVNGAGSSSANECDAGSFELQPETGGSFLISPTTSGTTGGVAFTPSDILKVDPAGGWSMFFDGSAVGINRNLSAFDVRPDGTILMVFSGGQTIPGVGKFMPQDIALFTPTSLGPDTAGSFSWLLDGSTNLLTTSGERIDALVDLGNNRLALSTAGTAAVKLPNGTVLKAQDEDLLQLNLNNGHWSLYFDGTAVPGLKAEDINAAWIDPASGDLYISLLDAFNLSGVRGNAKDIVKLSPTGSGYTPSLVWDGSAEGFKSSIDGLEMLP